jgi:Ca2+-dependent lipid-binding protein
MKGVDFGSFPLISKWIKESIFESLRNYVTPKYISIDIPAWLNGDPRIVSYMT